MKEELLNFNNKDVFVKELMVGNFKYHFRYVYNPTDEFYSMVYVRDISSLTWNEKSEYSIMSEKTFKKSIIKMQCIDESYMKAGTFYKVIMTHLDRVELETYYFDNTLTCIEDFKSKKVEIELQTYMKFL